jgi:hypothetical protein
MGLIVVENRLQINLNRPENRLISSGSRELAGPKPADQQPFRQLPINSIMCWKWRSPPRVTSERATQVPPTTTRSEASNSCSLDTKDTRCAGPSSPLPLRSSPTAGTDGRVRAAGSRPLGAKHVCGGNRGGSTKPLSRIRSRATGTETGERPLGRAKIARSPGRAIRKIRRTTSLARTARRSEATEAQGTPCSASNRLQGNAWREWAGV